VPPGWGLSVKAARARALMTEGPQAVELEGEWDYRVARWRTLDRR